ncbi:hypothetical protein Tco_0557319 [Tanacetum coccineum]
MYSSLVGLVRDLQHRLEQVQAELQNAKKELTDLIEVDWAMIPPGHGHEDVDFDFEGMDMEMLEQVKSVVEDLFLLCFQQILILDQNVFVISRNREGVVNFTTAALLVLKQKVRRVRRREFQKPIINTFH